MKILTLENKKELQPFIQAADYNEYNSNIITMLMWSSMYEVHFEIFDHFALVYTSMPNRGPIWMMPYCEKQYRQEALLKMEELSKEHSIAFEIHSMTLEFKNWLQAFRPLEFLVWDCENARDYVYDRKQQETLIGKKMQKRRNHFHAFETTYKDRMLYKPLEESDIPNIYTFLEKWKAGKESEESIDAEEQGIHFLLSHLQDLEIKGGCIYIDGQLEAFNITSRLSKDTIEIHVEKANHSIRGLYIAILKYFLETIEEDILFLNREDDMGKESLRKAKMDMHPIKKIRKLGCLHQTLTIRKANKEDIPQLKELWLNRFEEENEITTTYFFDHFFQLSDCHVLTNKNEIISMLQTRTMKIMLNNHEEKVPFFFAVATQAEYEGCSYMKCLMNHALEECRQTASFAFIQAHNWDLYRSFGFHEAYTEAVTKLDKQAYTVSNGVNSDQFTPKELLNIYQEYCKDKNGWRIRDENYYIEQLSYKALWNEHCLIHRTKDCADGYIFYREEEDTIQVKECCYQSKQALDEMLSILAQKEQKIYVHTDIETPLIGRRKTTIVMMIKELQEKAFPQEQLYISEEI